MHVVQGNLTGTETTVGILNSEDLTTGDRRFKKPKGNWVLQKISKSRKTWPSLRLKVQHRNQESGPPGGRQDHPILAEGLSGKSWSCRGYTATDRYTIKVERGKGRNILAYSFLLSFNHLLLHPIASNSQKPFGKEIWERLQESLSRLQWSIFKLPK